MSQLSQDSSHFKNCAINTTIGVALLSGIPREWKELLQNYPMGECTLTGLQKIRDIMRPSVVIHDTIIDRTFVVSQTAKGLWRHDLNIAIHTRLGFGIFSIGLLIRG